MKIWIVDFDGTLLNSAHVGFERLGVLAKKNNLYFDEVVQARLKKNWGFSPVKLISIGFDISEEKANDIYSQWIQMDFENPIPLIKGAKDFLEDSLKKGMHNFIFTSRHTENVHNVVERLKIVHLFKDVVGYDGGIAHTENNIQIIKKSEYGKPDPRALDKLLEFIKNNYCVELSDIGYIGDTDFDVLCGIGAGIPVFAVLTGFHTKEDFLKINVPEENIFSSIAEVSYNPT